MSLDMLDLTDGTRAALKSAKVETLDELLAFRDDYSAIRGIGATRAQELDLAVEAHELGRQERFDPPPESDPPPFEEPEQPVHPSGAALGDLVLFTSEHGRPRWARLASLSDDNKASLTVFLTGGGSYKETDVPFDPNGERFTWTANPNEEGR